MHLKEVSSIFISFRKDEEILQYNPCLVAQIVHTGNTAKILVLNSREVVHFHLKTHSTRDKDETRLLGREIHPYQPDPFPLYFATSECLVTR